MRVHRLALAVLWLTCFLRAHAADQVIDLAGAWNFALDPIDRGEASGWHRPEAGWTGGAPHPAAGWDAAEVPHDFLTDPRYRYTGTAWYRRSIPHVSRTSR